MVPSLLITLVRTKEIDTIEGLSGAQDGRQNLLGRRRCRFPNFSGSLNIFAIFGPMDAKIGLDGWKNNLRHLKIFRNNFARSP